MLKRISVYVGLLLLAVSSVTAQTNQISGVVYSDYNANGTQDINPTGTAIGGGTYRLANDDGIPGVTITAYDASGANVGTAMTGSDGTYTLTTSTAGPYRIEFTDFPAGYFSAPAATSRDTSVQFVPDGSSTDVNAGLLLPTDYCQNNPTLLTPCFVYGDQINGQFAGNPVVVSFPYNSGTTSQTDTTTANVAQPTTHTIMVSSDEIGSVFGLAYDGVDEQAYAAAYTKRHSGYGPGGPGAIYQINADGTPTTTATLFFDMNTLAGTPAGANFRSPTGHDYDRDGDHTGWDAVGKVGLGDMAIDPAGQYLYVMALGNRTLYRLPLNETPQAGVNILSQTVPQNVCGATDTRPFAVTYTEYGGVPRLYIGVTCTGESTYPANPPDDGTVGNPAALRMLVYEVNPQTLAFNGIVLNAPLNYGRGTANNSGVGGNVEAEWNTWSPDFRRLAVVSSDSSISVYPQPMLTSIAFDDGNMILALRDRNGDQVGEFTLSDPDSLLRMKGITAGDVLRACGNPDIGWNLESGGVCTSPDGTTSGAGIQPLDASQPQGPGGAEYYAADEYEPYFFPDSPTEQPGESGRNRHDEVSLGAVVQVPGYPESGHIVFDPAYTTLTNFDTGFNTAGLRWVGNDGLPRADTGNLVYRAYQVYETINAQISFAKANGLGDIVPFCRAAPVEIGNRVWFDTNGDGVQDADEQPIAGVEVELWVDTTGDGFADTLVAIVTTDSEGNYYFSSAEGTSTASTAYNLDFIFGGTYEIRIDMTQPVLSVWNPSPNDTSDDIRDSDGILDGTIVFTSFVIAAPGQNDHTYDFGFTEEEPPPVDTPTPPAPGTGDTASAPPGDQVATTQFGFSVTELPALGETPLWREWLWLILAGAASGLLLIGSVVWRRWRRS